MEFKLMSIKYKEHLEDAFFDKVVAIVKDSDALEEATKRVQELYKKGYEFICDYDELEPFVEQTWNMIGEKYAK